MNPVPSRDIPEGPLNTITTWKILRKVEEINELLDERKEIISYIQHLQTQKSDEKYIQREKDSLKELHEEIKEERGSLNELMRSTINDVKNILPTLQADNEDHPNV